MNNKIFNFKKIQNLSRIMLIYYIFQKINTTISCFLYFTVVGIYLFDITIFACSYPDVNQ